MSQRALSPPLIPDWSDGYAENRDSNEQKAIENLIATTRLFLRRNFRELLVGRPLRRALEVVNGHASELASLDADQLSARALALRPKLRRERLSGRATLKAFAIVRDLAGRTIGLRPYDVQILGGLGMFRGLLVEMETGEGKTLTATIPTAVAALAGVPVHVITVNDYLAERDAAFGAPLFDALGLSVGLVKDGQSEDERRELYKADIVYGTNKHIVFDYLRDRVRLAGIAGGTELKASWLSGPASQSSAPLLRGLHMAIVDEADSILIDEARTPLVLSRKRPSPEEAALAAEALALAAALEERRDYRVWLLERRIELTDRGKDRLEELAETAGPLLRGRKRREEAVMQALFAGHLLRRDEHYLVEDGKVQIIDEYTGRVMADRTWSRGLHQMVELKEECKPSDRSETLAQITYQRFFRRYRHLAGMTGTGSEVEGELWSVYRLPMMVLAPRRPNKRIVHVAAVAPTAAEKWSRIIERVRELSGAGRPVLIGTRTVRASAEVSALLTAAGIRHNVLNATNHGEEAGIVAEAGRIGQVTVATNLAGRGTDIKLGAGVVELGGLAVILTERHDAGRIDRQLIGRCARQGDPGLAESHLALDDEQLRQSSLRHALPLLARLSTHSPRVGQPLARFAVAWAQREQERLHADIREACVAQDRQLARLLAFSGPSE